MTSLAFILIACAAASPSTGSGSDGSVSEARLSHCLVSLIEELEVPAQEAGQLVAVEAREGLEVETGVLLARIDDALAQSQRTIAQFDRESAATEATNDIGVRYAKAATRVAEAEYLQSVQANKKTAGTISQAEMRKRLLDWKRASLEIEQSTLDLTLAGLKHRTKGAEFDAAQISVDRREIRAPISGMVVAMLRKRGEWVNPGDPVLRLIRIDRLRIEGFVQASEFGPHEISNCPVTVDVPLARGQVEQFEGKVVFVNPTVESGEMRVWAEVVNRAVAGQWLLRPGLDASMTIHLTHSVKPAVQLTRKPAAKGPAVRTR